jgi:hypothetical protein
VRFVICRPSTAVAGLLASVLVLAAASVPVAQSTPAKPSSSVLGHEARARFLETAKVTRTREVGKGVTNSLRVTLSDGAFTHDAHVQTIDDYKSVFQTPRGTELNFYDTWRYNVGAYRLSLMLGIDMVPVTVERMFRGKPASFTWWVDDVLMEESERLKKDVHPPDQQRWNEQLWTLRVFDQLIENVDRNLGNMLIDKDWKVWMIDHTRAFRRHKELRSAKNLSKIDRELLLALGNLTLDGVKQQTAPWLNDDEIRPMLERRDLIVAHFEKLGPSAVFVRPTTAAFGLLWESPLAEAGRPRSAAPDR